MKTAVSELPFGERPGTEPAAAPADESTKLGVWDAVSIIVGIVIGTTVFKIPWLIFANTEDPYWGLIVWVAGGLLALVGAFCYAELATTYPKSGGDYVYLNRAYGSWAGFLFGWAQLAVVLTASIGSMAYVFAEFASNLFDLSTVVNVGLSSQFLYATLAIFALSLLNILGVVVGKTAQNLLSIAKVIGLLAIIVAGFGWAEPNQGETWQKFTNPVQTFPWGSLAMILVLYAYGGWNDAAFVASEVKNPERNIPRALLWGVGLITFFYILVNLAYITGLGWEEVRKPGPVPAKLLAKPLGDFGSKAMSILVMVSALGAVNGLIFAGARVYASLGNDHPIFTWLGHWKAGKGAPILALFVQALITLSMVYVFGTEHGRELANRYFVEPVSQISFVKDHGIEFKADWKTDGAFEALVSHSAPVFWVFFLMTGISLFILRMKDSDLVRPFRVPLFPITPLIFCAMCGYMLYQSVIYVKWGAMFCAVLVLLGIPLYLLSWIFGYRGQSAE